MACTSRFNVAPTAGTARTPHSSYQPFPFGYASHKPRHVTMPHRTSHTTKGTQLTPHIKWSQVMENVERGEMAFDDLNGEFGHGMLACMHASLLA